MPAMTLMKTCDGIPLPEGNLEDKTLGGHETVSQQKLARPAQWQCLLSRAVSLANRP